jgi:hypothetical protein
MRFLAENIVTIEKQDQLMSRGCHGCSIRLPRPWKSGLFQSFHPQSKPRPVEVERLDRVTALAAKYEECLLERVEIQVELNIGGKTIDHLPSVNQLRAQIHPFESCKLTHPAAPGESRVLRSIRVILLKGSQAAPKGQREDE